MPRIRHPLPRTIAWLLPMALAACGEGAPPPARAPLTVAAQTVALTDYAPTVTLTGEVRAQVQTDLSFRVSGRVVERSVDVGSHVTPDQPLARLDPQEQQANLSAAEASVEAAEAQLRQATANFERQKTLIGRGFTTRREYDQAEEAFRTAQAQLDSARAQLALARDNLSHTVLRAGVSGIITARNIEAGQVVQAAQTAFTIAQDGPRDAVFNVYEQIFTYEGAGSNPIEIALISDPTVRTTGKVREVSPTVDPATGTVRVKVGIDVTPPAMTLGAAVSGTGRFRSRQLVLLPWSALTENNGNPAVWIVDPQTRAVSLRGVTIEAYRTEEIVIRDGLKPGEIVVTAGAQLLRPQQVVAFAQGGAR
jgi:membrane fusion protein, multidrug efflux system